MGLSATQRYSFSSDAFNGASYQFSPKSLGRDPHALLNSIPSVKKSWPVETVPGPNFTINSICPLADNFHSNSKRSIGIKTTKSIPHIMTQVDRMQAEGITGKGIKVGILDTRVDYTHPALGAGVGPGHLIVRQSDHVKKSNTICEHCEGHGTHVAGILAAQPNKLGFIGAAPGVELSTYRVIGCSEEETSMESVLNGLHRAYTDGNQIITASFGRAEQQFDSVSSLVEYIADRGVIVTAAIRNDGLNGRFERIIPASRNKVVAIGSAENGEVPRFLRNATYRTNDGTAKAFVWSPAVSGSSPWVDVELPLAVGQSTETRDCDNFKNAGDMTGKVVLVKASACSDTVDYMGFATREGDMWSKAEMAVKRGAEHVLFYSENEATDFMQPPDSGEFRNIPRAAGMVPYSTAQEFIRLQRSGQQITLQMDSLNTSSQRYIDRVPNARAGLTSKASNWGFTYRPVDNISLGLYLRTEFELNVKPDVLTPGEPILSTWPVDHGGYAVLSGTSMATPLAAGIFALLLEARKNMSVADLKTLLATTAKPVAFTTNAQDTSLAPVLHQGSGMAQVWNAAHATTLLSTTKLIFGDTLYPTLDRSFTIRNIGSGEVTYTLTNRVAKTFYVLGEGEGSPDVPDEEPPSLMAPSPKAVKYADAVAEIVFANSSVVVPAGHSVEVELALIPPKGLRIESLPIYSGFITLDGSNGDKLSLPYVGAVGSAGRMVPGLTVLLGLTCFVALLDYL
ncbi:subtilisin-like protein [Lophiostoma macrostomum CBS 122681]|uniref:Subtilisin-like protein n=1 Tax=Lophiostoma macrostomum CBS 122681 TaxID=1314788 RepID=A0A6A6TLH1_9PLEO|nr:subtilisin-like protein [Lophiostoma macrostomum CBS 122681]